MRRDSQATARVGVRLPPLPSQPALGHLSLGINSPFPPAPGMVLSFPWVTTGR